MDVLCLRVVPEKQSALGMIVSPRVSMVGGFDCATMYLLDYNYNVMIYYSLQKLGLKPKPGQANLAKANITSLPAYDFSRLEPGQAKPKPGLSGQAGAGTSLAL